ncbi:ribonuclease H-like domain-containing protein [Tanacetum coccineum]
MTIRMPASHNSTRRSANGDWHISLHDFFKQLKSKSDRLANHRIPGKRHSLVTYAINGVRSKYPDAARVIRLREKAPTFDELRSLMLLEESDMSNSSHGNSSFHNTSSSPTVLVASTSNANKMTYYEPRVWMGVGIFSVAVHDYQTRRLLLRCDSTGDLYPVTQQPSTTSTFALITLSPTTWHRRLGHPSDDVLRRKHTKLPFYSSVSHVASVFDIVHSDLWTSPISSESGIKYYAIFLDHFSHYVWVCGMAANLKHSIRHTLFRQMAAKFRDYLVPNLPTNGKSEDVTHKFNEDGSLSMYKTWLVANGQSQQQGIGCDETFSLVVKPATCRYVLSLACYPVKKKKSEKWPIISLDVKNAFLHGQLSETVYMHQPPGFVDSTHPDYRSSSGLFLSQSKFAEEILERAHMQHCNPCRTPVDTESKLGSDGDPVSDPTLYRSLAGALQYLTFTRPDISYAVQQVCLYMHDPRAPHFTALKRILRYVRGTLTFGLQIHASTTAQLTAYTDADWAGCPVTISRSSAETSIAVVAHVVLMTAWIRNLLLGVACPSTTDYFVYCDNAHQFQSAQQFQPAQQLQYGLSGPPGFGSPNMKPIAPPQASHQATMLPHAFQTMTLQEPAWNMDTGASSHLAENTGKHTKLPFYSSVSHVASVFDIVHSDLWTSPISSESGIKYYAIFLDHFSHYVWVYPLLHKSDLFDTFVTFRAYVNQQFNVDIKALQCDHGGEFDNTRFHTLFRQHGIQFRFSCPKTSQQNGKSERMLRTLNNITRTLLF